MQQRTQAKNRVHAILHRNLIAPQLTDLFGQAGRRLLARIELPAPERTLLEADLRVIDFLNFEVAAVERHLARAVHQDPQVLRLLTVPGIALASAVALKAAIGDVGRFGTPQRLVSYFGLNPSVHQSGQKAYTGHISRRGRSHARSACVEAAHVLVKTPGPFQAFFRRLRRRKPYNVAITAVARKLVVLVWHMLTRGEDYHYAPPARTRAKLSRLRYQATGQRARKGELPAPAPDPARDQEPGRAAQRAYEQFIRQRFGPEGPKGIEPPNRHATRTNHRRKSKVQPDS